MMKFNTIFQRIVFRQHSAHLGFHGGIPNIDEHVFIFSQGADHGGEHGRDAVVEVRKADAFAARPRQATCRHGVPTQPACDSRAGRACSGRSSFKAEVSRACHCSCVSCNSSAPASSRMRSDFVLPTIGIIFMDAASATPELLPPGWCQVRAPWHRAVGGSWWTYIFPGRRYCAFAIAQKAPSQWAPSHGGNLVFLTLIKVPSSNGVSSRLSSTWFTSSGSFRALCSRLTCEGRKLLTPKCFLPAFLSVVKALATSWDSSTNRDGAVDKYPRNRHPYAAAISRRIE